MPENKNQKYRFVILDELMKSKKGYTINELHDKINWRLDNEGKKMVTSRTIRNDINDIQSIYNVFIIEENGHYRYEDPDDTINKFGLTADEKNVMDVARQTLSIFKGSPIFKQFDEVSARILGGAVLRSVDTVNSNYIQIGDGGVDAGVKWLQTIYKAIVDKKALKIGYRPYSGELKTRTISPYILKEYRNKWYMVCHARELKSENKTNVFKLSRIDSIEQCEEIFVVDELFHRENYFKFSLGVFHSHENQPVLVRLQLSKSITPLVKESPMHASMKFEKEDENVSIINMYVYNTPELKNMIMAYGSQCKVLSPESLKEEIRNDLKSALKNYE